MTAFDFDRENMKKGRTLLLFAAVGLSMAYLMIIHSYNSSNFATMLSLLTLFVSWGLGVAGIARVGEPSGMPSALVLLYWCLLPVPILGYLPVIHGFVNANKTLLTSAKREKKANEERLLEQIRREQLGNIKAPSTDHALAHLNSVLPVVKAVFDTKQEKNGKLNPNIKPEQLAMLKLTAEDLERKVPLTNVCCGFFQVNYLIQLNEKPVYLTQVDIDRAEISLEQLHQMAVNNLMQKIDKGKAIRFEQSDGLSLLSVESDLEASLLLLDVMWDKAMQAKYPQGYVVALPFKDTLLVASMADKKAVQNIESVVQNVASYPKKETAQTQQNKHIFSKHLYVRHQADWQLYQADQQHNRTALV